MYETAIKAIADYYGTENQLVQTAEESSELTQAALKLNRKYSQLSNIRIKDIDEAEEHLIEELADNFIMTEQMLHLLGKGAEEKFLRMVEYKLDRQLERIGKGRYDA